jgi:hypothetical protein
MLYKDLGREYNDIYIRFYIRFKNGFQRRALSGEDGFAFKLIHAQHITDGSTPYSYHAGTAGVLNQPFAAVGINQWSNYLQVYGGAYCQQNISCGYSNLVWPISTITAAYQEGGLFDGNWHSFEYRVKMNSSVGASDGAVEVWVDGVKLSPWPGYNATTIPFNDSGSPEMRGIRAFTIGGNSYNQWDTSCSNMAECEQWYAIDDLVVGNTYIGPGDSVAQALTAPTGLKVVQ